MAEETTTPTPAPAPTPARTSATTKVIAVVAVAVVGVAAFLAVDHFVFHRDPLPAPKAVVKGVFWPAPAPAGAASAPGSGPAPIGMFRLDATGSTSILPFRWKTAGPKVSLRIYTPLGSLIPGTVAEADVYEPGQYGFHGIAIGHSGGQLDADVDTANFSVEAPTPVPPPTPPAPPDPPPVPPDPPSPPGPPAPIAGDGLRVLFVYESADLGKYPKQQIVALYGGAVRDYLDATCPKVGAVPEYRLFDKDVDASNESKTWQDAMKRPRASLPWIVVSNGKAGFEGPLPGNLADTLALIKKYGEAR